MRLPFYEIPRERYLIAPSPSAKDAKPMPEEAVRQWCAFELIREYGISPCELEFEAQVQIGHRPKRIDILVHRNGKPWAVVECKSAKEKSPDKALTQAESYATAPGIRAEFVIYTNGTTWIVRRQIGGRWVPVVDLPKQHDRVSASEDVAQLLRDIDYAKPLLANIDTPLSGKAAKAYFEALQIFFHGGNLFTYRTHEQLRFAIDNLLRVISRREPGDAHYEAEKTHAAARSLEAFRGGAKIGYEIYVNKEDSPERVIHTVDVGLSHMLESTDSIKSEDSLALRTFKAFADYARRQSPKEVYPETPLLLHQAVRDYLELGFAVGLNAKLPDGVDSFSMRELRAAAGGSFETVSWLKRWLARK
jgi:hypothetical protein